MSRLNKTEQIIELAMMFQNSYCGLCIASVYFRYKLYSAERYRSEG